MAKHFIPVFRNPNYMVTMIVNRMRSFAVKCHSAYDANASCTRGQAKAFPSEDGGFNHQRDYKSHFI